MTNEVIKNCTFSAESLQELKRILREDFNANTSLDEVAEIADKLVKYFELLIKIQNNSTKA